MVVLKTRKEIEKMREAGRISAGALKAAGAAVEPGISTYEIDEIARKYILRQGARPNFLHYNGFPATACISINDEVIHGIPRFLAYPDAVARRVGALAMLLRALGVDDLCCAGNPGIVHRWVWDADDDRDGYRCRDFHVRVLLSVGCRLSFVNIASGGFRGSPEYKSLQEVHQPGELWFRELLDQEFCLFQVLLSRIGVGGVHIITSSVEIHARR